MFGGAPPTTLFGGAPAANRHETINCDGCGANPITGVRYKCSQCANYDLCEQCIGRFERFELQHGPDSSVRAHRHLFLRISDPLVTAAGRVDTCNLAESIHNVACSGCGAQQIVGFRYSCQLCPNVNLCGACEALGTKHDATHPRVKACQRPGAGTGCAQPVAPAVAPPAEKISKTEPSLFTNRVTGGLFGMAHVTSGRDGGFNPFTQTAPQAAAPQGLLFGMAHVTSGRDGGFGNLFSQPQSN